MVVDLILALLQRIRAELPLSCLNTSSLQFTEIKPVFRSIAKVQVLLNTIG